MSCKERGSSSLWLAVLDTGSTCRVSICPLSERERKVSSVFEIHLCSQNTGWSRSLSELEGRLAQEGKCISPTWLMAQIPGVIFVKLLGGRPPLGRLNPEGRSPGICILTPLGFGSLAGFGKLS